jgi:hypothetical protein
MDAWLGDAVSHRNTLIHLNPDQFEPLWWRLQELGALHGRRIIGYWYWELDVFPAKWRPALERVDEIWVASAFVQQTMLRATDKPVILMPPAIDVHPAQPASRADFGLSEDAFLFLFSFDFSSCAERKNPQAVLRAFRSAFAPADPRVGLGMAQSMALGKPVIGTGYSGNLEFMNPDNSCLVDYRLVPVRPGQYGDYEPDWQRAEPDEAHATARMRRLVQEPEYGARIAGPAP